MKLIFSSLLALILLSAPGSVTLANGQGQVTNVQVLEGGDNGRCPSVEERERARNEIHQIVASVVTSALPTTTASTTVSSTTTSAVTTPTTVSTMTDCGGPGWRRVAFINMTDTSYNCPTGLNLTSYSKRTCGRSHTSYGCSSTTFSVGGLLYSRVCGRIRGYQVGEDVAFYTASQGINSYHPVLSQHLLEMITSARVVYTQIGMTVTLVYSFPMFSGMVRAVHPTARAVSSTTLHGLQRTCPLQQLMILN